MKKILFATTALVATAGAASAQGVELSGMAEMGIFNPSTENAETQFLTDLDITFTMSGEADNGLTFGATIDLDEAADRTNVGLFESDGVQGGENMFVSYGGATLTMGDTDGAYDAIVPEMALAGSTLTDDETTHAGFNDGSFLDGGVAGSDGQIARFDYAWNGFTFALSAEQVANGADVPGVGDTIWGVGVGYTGMVSTVEMTAGLGYQELDDFYSETGVGVTAAFTNGLSVGATYTKFDPDISGVDETDHVGLGVGYEMNALAVGVNWGKYDTDGTETSGWGLAAEYDLGGGLAAKLGYGSSDFAGAPDDDSWSLGLAMSF
ncbi:porin [Salipiger mucosus]|uniref:Porin domain-containing protein n=1 Tax=Salipiger mucosus DSM 16094 TaxID=1123237 RepID=S9QJ69_9RHOB|nr:porin [Salipiger mucosus]EPX79588.1 hypothetical protein Salmuc_05528 [Salipiger mucosus DSM 16094]